MSAQPDTPQPAALGETRPFSWSVRRELWENRSLSIAPLVVTAVVLLANLISLIGLPERLRSLSTNPPAEQYTALVRHLRLAPAAIMLAALLVGFFYALDALYGERRDRSLLFWKSLPVSDLTTVLAKASIPLVVLPLYAFVLSVVAVALILLLSTLVLLASGVNPAPLWREARLLEQPIVMFYGLAAHALWFAPLYSWLLLISAWARRTPLLWVVLPPAAIAVLERIAFNTTYVCSLLGYRLRGAMEEAFASAPRGGDAGGFDRLAELDPLRFLSSPGLWTGLVFAGLCLALAVWLRRRREPL